MSGKPLPVLTSDEGAERFVAEADLSDYDLSKGRWVRFVFGETERQEVASVRLPSADLELAHRNARSEGVSLDAYLGRLVHDSLAKLAV